MRAFIVFMLCVSTTLALSGCFDPKLPDVAFQCGDGGACPSGYECRDDGCCHAEGSPLDEHGPCNLPDAGLDAEVTLDASA